MHDACQFLLSLTNVSLSELGELPAGCRCADPNTVHALQSCPALHAGAISVPRRMSLLNPQKSVRSQLSSLVSVPSARLSRTLLLHSLHDLLRKPLLAFVTATLSLFHEL